MPTHRRSISRRRLRRAVAVAAAVVAIVGTIGVGSSSRPADGAPDESLGALLDRFRLADADAREEARRAILASSPSPAALVAAIREGTRFSADVPRGVASVPADGMKEPLELFVPDDYDPSRAYPLMIGLHGTGGDGRQVRDPAVAICKREGWILACPTLEKPDILNSILRAGRDGFGWGEHADNLVLKTLDHVLRHYRIDTDRVYLLGVSLGGYGTWGIGSAYPHRFAALMAYAGGIDYRENFSGTMGRLLGGRDGEGDAETGFTAGHGMRRDLLLNLRHTPIAFVHGSRDRVVEPQGDRRSAARLKELGYDHIYVEKEGWGHVPAEVERGPLVDELVAWARRRRRASPDDVIYFAAREDTRVASWIVLEEHERGALLKARRTGDGAIEIEATHVKRLTILLEDGAAPRSLTVNGVRRALPPIEAHANVVLDSYARWWDPGRLYAARVTVDVGPRESPAARPPAPPAASARRRGKLY